MDAVKFVEERRRMFAMTGENPKYSLFNMGTPAEDVVREVEKWAAAHPHKTRQSAFLKQYSEAHVDGNGVLSACPALISSSHRRDGEVGCKNSHKECADCRREFWMQEAE